MDWRSKNNATLGKVTEHSGWLENMNRAVTFFEESLTGEVDVEHAAQIACCSSYHFQRIFSFLAGVPLSEYIRRRRLTLAAFDLQAGKRVLDVALDYGYESPEAFARAFKRLHGVMPSAVKDKSVALKACPRISFHISVKGEAEMDYCIETKEGFTMFGVKTHINTEDGAQITAVPAFWKQCREDGSMEHIRQAAGIPADTPLHASTFHCTDSGYDYLIGYHCPDAGISESFTILEIPSATWAVFSTAQLSLEDAAQEIQLLWSRIFTEWFPTSGYELADAPELEMHYGTGSELYSNEIWIPVAK